MALSMTLADRSRGLRKVKAMLSLTPQDRAEIENEIAQHALSPTAKRMLRIMFENPWHDYGYNRPLVGSDGTVVRRKASYFSLAVIRELPYCDALTCFQLLSSIKHPNIVATHDAYCFEDRILIVTDH